jgi:tetratricopeptide (TPR) repeat protein
MLNRNDEAITAADAALAVEGNLTTVHSIAWYNKGNALRALGRIDEARTAYANANALDPTLVAPALPSGTITVQPTTVPVSGQSPVATSSGVPRPSATKSPLSLPVVFISLFAALACCRYFRAAEK